MPLTAIASGQFPYFTVFEMDLSHSYARMSLQIIHSDTQTLVAANNTRATIAFFLWFRHSVRKSALLESNRIIGVMVNHANVTDYGTNCVRLLIPPLVSSQSTNNSIASNRFLCDNNSFCDASDSSIAFCIFILLFQTFERYLIIYMFGFDAILCLVLSILCYFEGVLQIVWRINFIEKESRAKYSHSNQFDQIILEV